MVYVKNLNFVTKPTCECGSWKRHYCLGQDYKPTICQNQDCYRKASQYVLVSQVYFTPKKTWVVVFCKECASSRHYKDVISRRLTRADPLVTCKNKRHCVLF